MNKISMKDKGVNGKWWVGKPLSVINFFFFTILSHQKQNPKMPKNKTKILPSLQVHYKTPTIPNL
jgi:hypothetical protein